MTKDGEPSSTLPRRHLGRVLEAARQGAGFTVERAAELMEMGKASLGRIEKGQNQKVPERIVEGYGRLYGLGEDDIAELKDLAEEKATKSWYLKGHRLIRADYGVYFGQPRRMVIPGFSAYLGLESAASQLRFYHPLTVPGLLQTADYARAVEGPYLPSDTPEDIEHRVELRLKRAVILTRSREPVQAEFVIQEAALHTIAGSRAVMAGQHRHLAHISTLPNVTIQILPFSAGFPGGWNPVLPYIIVDFPSDSHTYRSEPPVVYAEGTIGTVLSEDEDDVRRYREIHNDLRCAALGEQESRAYLRALATRYEQ
ncbi:helix-turn-helix domain-containing protein [Nocardia terpenica]|nr:helix-turn-helix transcriptional regulator [Nocardia terpenica]